MPLVAMIDVMVVEVMSKKGAQEQTQENKSPTCLRQKQFLKSQRQEPTSHAISKHTKPYHTRSPLNPSML